MTASRTVEQLWASAHDHVRRGDFANAVRDLAECFAILQANNDPRMYEVHRRWTEVHRMYVEDGARQPAAQAEVPHTAQAEAEARANAGDLEGAIAQYESIARASPSNELAAERLAELRAAKQRADALTRPQPPAVAHAEFGETPGTEEWTDVGFSSDEGPGSKDVDEDSLPPQHAAQQHAAPQPAAPERAVAVSAPTTPSAAAAATSSARPAHGEPAASIAFLEDLLERVHRNRRAA